MKNTRDDCSIRFVHRLDHLRQAGISVLFMALFVSHLNGISVKDFRTQ